jgi:hypothetical protein
MSSSVVFVLLIFGLIIVFNSVAINAESKNIGIKMIIPRGYTEQQYLKSIVDFWTPERMASAKPLAPMITKNYLISGFDDSQTGQIERVLTPSAPLPGTRSVHPPSAGRAFFVLGNATYVCSGSVVNAKNRAMIVTAGHCVYDTKSNNLQKTGFSYLNMILMTVLMVLLFGARWRQKNHGYRRQITIMMLLLF